MVFFVPTCRHFPFVCWPAQLCSGASFPWFTVFDVVCLPKSSVFRQVDCSLPGSWLVLVKRYFTLGVSLRTHPAVYCTNAHCKQRFSYSGISMLLSRFNVLFVIFNFSFFSTFQWKVQLFVKFLCHPTSSLARKNWTLYYFCHFFYGIILHFNAAVLLSSGCRHVCSLFHLPPETTVLARQDGNWILSFPRILYVNISLALKYRCSPKCAHLPAQNGWRNTLF